MPQLVDRLGGQVRARWGECAAATTHGQSVFFAEFLATTGVFDRWVWNCRFSSTTCGLRRPTGGWSAKPDTASLSDWRACDERD